MTTDMAIGANLAESIERVLVGGDLSQLKSEERIVYYRRLCESLGLNPLSKPFEYITLNGKLRLYALKDATDQLRKNNHISINIVGREVVDDCYIVTARATRPDGRMDESIGAVPIGGLKGDAKCNALMKGETKAKRRVTLSICGLGMLDETEIDSIPGSVSQIKEVVTFARPVKVPDVPISGQHATVPVTSAKDGVADVKATAESISPGGVTLADAPSAPAKPVIEILREQAAKLVEEKKAEEQKYISTQQQSYLARRFRESLRPEIQPHAEEFRHDWLRINGYMEGPNPSSSAIPSVDYKTVGEKMVQFAKTL